MEASRLQTPALILLALLTAWLLSVVPFRRHRWAVAGWLPATGLAAVGTLAIFVVVMEFIHLTGVGGEAAGFAAIGAAHKRRVMVRTTDGRQLRINHPDFMAFAQDSTEFLCFPPDGGFELVPVSQIASVQVSGSSKIRP